MTTRIVVLPGDGVGPEVIAAARQVLEAVAARQGLDLAFDERLIGGAAIDATGEPLPIETVDACIDADAVLLGAVGHPRFDAPDVNSTPEQGLLGLRRGLGLYASIRPVRAYAALADASPLRPERLAGIDLVVVRELAAGLYFGAPRFQERGADGLRAVDTMEYNEHDVRRVVRLACQLARGRRKHVTSVDKANVLQSSRLWRRIADQVAAEFRDVDVNHRLIDSAAMRLIVEPRTFDVIVTHNMFGDILSNEASVLAGSLGLLPSASVSKLGPSLYEPVHGSAPDIAGQGVANPIGAILSVAMLLRRSAAAPAAADAVESAVAAAIDGGARTPDLGGALSTQGMTDAILAQLGAAPRRATGSD